MAKKKGRGASKSKAKDDNVGIEFDEAEEAAEGEAEQLDLPPAVDALTDLVDQCGVFAEWIDKAKNQAEKFRPEIVQKVITDYTAKYEEAVVEMQPHIREIEESLSGERELPAGLEEKLAAKEAEREELALRQLIGELADDAFAEADAGLEAEAAELRAELEVIGARRNALDGALQRALAAQRLLEESGGKLPDDVALRGVEVEVVGDAQLGDLDSGVAEVVEVAAEPEPADVSDQPEPEPADVADQPEPEPADVSDQPEPEAADVSDHPEPADASDQPEPEPAPIAEMDDFIDIDGVEEVEANPDTSELGDDPDLAAFEEAFVGEGFLDDEPAQEEAEEAPAEEPVADEPVADEPFAEEPLFEEPVAEEPVAEEPLFDEPVAEEPVAEEPVAEEPVADEPLAEEPFEPLVVEDEAAEGSDGMAGAETEHPEEPIEAPTGSQEEAGETINAPEMDAFDAEEDQIPDSAFEEALSGTPAEGDEVGSARNARVLLRPKQGEEEEIAVTGAVFSVGRGRNNDIQVKNDGKVSRYHCRIIFRENEYVIEDNKSSNGTIVDGRAIARKALAGGEQIVIGETSLTFLLD